MPSFGREDNGMADDRIAHILNEAQSMLKPSMNIGGQPQSQPDDSQDNDESDSMHNQSLSPFSKDALNRRRKYDNDDISQEKVARIYQEELAKLMSRGPRDAFQRYVSESIRALDTILKIGESESNHLELIQCFISTFP